VLQRLADAGLVEGKTIGLDATTLEANAALRSIVRPDTGESYVDFLTGLAHASASRHGRPLISRGSIAGLVEPASPVTKEPSDERPLTRGSE